MTAIVAERTIALWRLRAVARTGAARDALGVVLLLAVTAANAWNLLGGGTMIGLDTAAHFFPAYAFLGDRLRAGDIPGWNPHQFAGVPFAADPETGWAYLPAMVLFAALPFTVAAAASIVFHFLLAGLATYALARSLGMNVLGALIAATAYESSGFLVDRSVCCLVHVQVGAWLPLALLGAERAIRAGTWLGRGCWWGVSGLAVSQILAAWVGQGTYYALLALGAFVLYRALLAPPTRARLGPRLAAPVLHGGAILLFGFALAAAGLLPRLEYNPLTNLAGGQYRGDLAWAAVIGGWEDPRVLAADLLGRSGWAVGGATAALALVALPVAGARVAVPYTAALVLGALVLAAKQTTPLHAALYALLPRFETLHRHFPDRILFVFYLGVALLAGDTVSALGRWHRRPALLVFLAGLPILAVLGLLDRGVLLPRTPLHAVVFASLLLAAYALLPAAPVRRIVPALLLVVVLADLLATGRDVVHNDPTARGRLFYQVDLDRYVDPAGATAFLRSRGQDEPFRFFGYDPGLMPAPDGFYRYGFIDQRAMALLLNNRATLFGLQDIQGYNPIQPRRYVDFMNALNGHPQEYHEANVHAGGLDSPLLDLLNARYIVVPAVVPSDRPDLAQLVRVHPTVYEDALVRVLENREALPRAWIVHAAQQVAPGDVLALLAAGGVDPRRVALLEEPPPALQEPSDPATDQAVVTANEPDRLRVRTRTTAAGLLVLSETAHPAWRAFVDGEPTEVLTANHLLRAVPIPPGEHTVELRFESRALRLGTAISLGALGALLGLMTAAAWQQLRWMAGRRSPGLRQEVPAGGGATRPPAPPNWVAPS